MKSRSRKKESRRDSLCFIRPFVDEEDEKDETDSKDDDEEEEEEDETWFELARASLLLLLPAFALFWLFETVCREKHEPGLTSVKSAHDLLVRAGVK